MIALKKRIKNKRFLLSFCALLVAVASVSVGITLALTKVNPYTTNVVTIGEVKIELIDDYYTKDMAANGQTYTEADPPVFKPNVDVTKTVKVENVGDYPCYVRLLVRKAWSYKDTSGVTHNLSDNITWTSSSNWVEGDTVTFDGESYTCYYYQKVLPVKGVTEGLFDGNKFHIGNYNRDWGSQAIGHIVVKAQAVQSDYTDGSFGNTPSSTFMTDDDGNVVKWNGLIFE